MTSRATWLGIVAGAITLGFGCGGEELSGPPELRPGRDECAECGMLIHDERAASALLVDRDGRREHLLFDDTGCMLDHEDEHAGELRVVEGFVHDHATRAWTPSAGAVFLLTESDRLPTPMGSGIAAFADRAGGEEAQAEFGGELMDYAALAVARRLWLETRYGRTQGGP